MCQMHTADKLFNDSEGGLLVKRSGKLFSWADKAHFVERNLNLRLQEPGFGFLFTRTVGNLFERN